MIYQLGNSLWKLKSSVPSSYIAKRKKRRSITHHLPTEVWYYFSIASSFAWNHAPESHYASYRANVLATSYVIRTKYFITTLSRSCALQSLIHLDAMHRLSRVRTNSRRLYRTQLRGPASTLLKPPRQLVSIRIVAPCKDGANARDILIKLICGVRTKFIH